MSDSTDLLILTDDPQLQAELRTAAAAVGERQPRLRFAADRHALLAANRTLPEPLRAPVSVK
jgi:hypothetical protein